MAKFKLSFSKKDNSHPKVKVALREWLILNCGRESILDVYGANGLMYESVWKDKVKQYIASSGESISFLNGQGSFDQQLFDIDPYASPYEAIKVICSKSTKNKIGIVCTDGCLRRVCMMRTGIPEFIQAQTGWPKKDLSLMAAIYHRYPEYLRYLLKCVIGDYRIDKLVIKYGQGTWKQATVYFAACLSRSA